MSRAILFVFFILILQSCKKEEQPLPNILFVMMDDLGFGQFGLHNDTLSTDSFDPYFMSLVNMNQDYTPEQALEFSKIAMPTMNKLAREGAMFTNAYTSSSLCAPSRLSIATGILPARLGVYRNTDCEERGLDPGSHLAERLHDLGYATAHIGKWHIGRRNGQLILEALQRHGIKDTLSYSQIRRRFPAIYKELLEGGYYGSVIDAHHPLQNGFDYYYGYNNWASQFYNSTLVWENHDHAGKQEGYNTDVFTDTAMAFIQKQVGKGQPFYVQLHYHAVHDSLEPKAPDRYFNQFNSDSYDLNNFYGHVYGVDYNLKRITDYLESVGEDKNTIIVFTSDNGAQAGGPSVLPGNAPFSGHKGTYYLGGIRVPLIFHWPDGIKKSQRISHLASALDILPTLIAAAGERVPENIDGKSLLPLLSGQSEEPVHDQLVWAGLHARAWGFLINTSYRGHGDERNYAPPAWTVIKDDYLLRYVGEIETDLYHELPDGKGSEYELFNFVADPDETQNLSDQMPEKVKELTSIYFREASDFAPPLVWKRAKWEEIRPEKMKD